MAKQKAIFESVPDEVTCECCCEPEESLGYGYKADKAALINRLSRIEGQVRGVRGMVEKNTYCDDILNQIAAIQSALKAVSRVIFQGHVKGCMVEKISKGEMEAVDELLKTMEKMMR